MNALWRKDNEAYTNSMIETITSSDTEPPAIVITGLFKQYDDFHAVEDLSFEVAAGDFFAFLGPNGAGKTTTINAIVGLANFQQGAIHVFGHDVVHDYRAARRLVGVAPQDYNFDRYLTVLEILTYQGGYFGIPYAEALPRARALLEQFGLWDKRDKEIAKLSGGMKRRLTLARALIHAPNLLILDEPTAGVDLELRLELWSFLRALNQQGTTIFLTTHYLEEAEHLCNRVGIVNQGRLVALDTKERLLNRGSQEQLCLRLERPLREIPGSLDAYDVRMEEGGQTLVVGGAVPADYPRILRALEARGAVLVEMHTKRHSLQDIFLELTGKRDEL